MLRSSLFVVGTLLTTLVLFVTGAVGGPAAPASFPVTIVTPAGKVTVARRPTRIVSLSPTATESLFAIGAGAQVIAVDDQSDYPKTAPKTTLSGFTPNVEAIAEYRPDLVVIAYDPKGLSGALRRLGSRSSITTGRSRLTARTSRSANSAPSPATRRRRRGS